MNLPLLLSVVLHVFFIVSMGISWHNPFSKKIEDKGYAVFEFKKIGAVSKAPIISTTKNHASKKKGQKEQEKEKSKTRESVSNKQEDKHKQKAVNLEKNKKNNKQKEQKRQKKTNSKKTDKAVVNLKKNSKSIQKTNQNAPKKSINSMLDDIAATSENENDGVKAEEIGEVLTANQIDLVRQTIRKCWHFPAGLKKADELSVDIKMELAEDGTVTKAEIINKERMNSDPDFKIAAENAHRAVLDPECNPLPLPKEKYKEWKDLELTFNPKDMLD